MFSVNFDSRFERGQRLGPGYRVGIGCAKGGLLVSGASDRLSDRGYVTIPAGVNWVFGKPGSSHTFEMGAAITCFTEKVDVHYADEFVDGRYCAGSLSFMYRFSPVKGGFACRIGLTPLFNFAGNTAIRMGASAGYAF